MMYQEGSEEGGIDRPYFTKNPSRQVKISLFATEGMTNQERRDEIILPIMLIPLMSKQGEPIKCATLLDSASTANFCTSRILSKVSYTVLKEKELIRLSTLHQDGATGSSPQAIMTRVVSFPVKLPNGWEVPLQFIELPTLGDHLKPYEASPPKFPDNFTYNHRLDVSMPVDLLLGTPSVWTFITSLPQSFKGSDYLLLGTTFGVVPCGKSGPHRFEHDLREFALLTSNDRLMCTIEKLWSIDELANDNVDSLTLDEQSAVDAMRHFTEYDPVGHYYTTRLLFKENDPNCRDMTNNYKSALRRFLSLEKRLERDPELKASYHEGMNSLIEAGVYIEAPDQTIFHERSTRCFLLPHQPVLREDSTTHACRIVFDASAGGIRGLNTHLYAGPPCVQEILRLHLRWRQHKVAFTSDIRKCFLMIHMHESCWPYQAFFWRDKKGELKVFVCTRVLFGVISSPFQSNYCVLQNATRAKEATNDPQLKLAADRIHSSLYVDDLLTGEADEESATRLRENIEKIMQEGSFELRKYISNNRQFMSKIPEERRAPDAYIHTFEFHNSQGAEYQTKALGIRYCPKDDSYRFGGFKDLDKEFTGSKRSLASVTAKVAYDILGYCAPYILEGRKLMQEAVRSKVEWDNMLDESLQIRVKEWLSVSHELDKLTLPRYLPFKPGYEIYGYADASQGGYAAVCYSRSFNPDSNKQESQFILARCRVAPHKRKKTKSGVENVKMTIPCLELLAALLLRDLVLTLEEEYNYPASQVTCYTDSQVVYFWCRDNPGTLIPFVGNRVKKIQEACLSFQYIPTLENGAADMASRGALPKDLTSDVWKYGPERLRLPKNEWEPFPVPASAKSNQEYLAGVRKKRIIEAYAARIVCTDTEGEAKNILVKAPNLVFLLNTTRYILRVRDLIKKTPFTGTQEEEKKRALLFWVRQVQKDHFAEEWHDLEKGNYVENTSKLAKLDPFIDPEEQIIRVGGRIEHSGLESTVVHPYVLPEKSQLTDLIIIDMHERWFHLKVDWLHYHLRLNCHIINARERIKHRIRGCPRCMRFGAKRQKVRMGNVPKSRLSSQVWDVVSVDFAGPFKIHEGYTHKGSIMTDIFVAVFVDHASKFIVAEIVRGLSAPAFLTCLSKVCGSFGFPRILFSDNGTNFKRSAKELRRMLIGQKKIMDRFFIDKGIDWRFIPPRAPHRNGLCEAAVGTMKKALKVAYGSINFLTYAELESALKLASLAVNSRPLSSMSSSASNKKLAPDFSPETVVTPNHLMFGRQIRFGSFEFGKFNTAQQTSVNKRWRRRENQHNLFLQTFRKNYIHSLNQRHKWTRTQMRPLQVGDCVLVEKVALRPNRMDWPIAMIEENLTPEGGEMYTCKVRFADGSSTVKDVRSLFRFESDQIEETDRPCTAVIFDDTMALDCRYSYLI